MSRLVQRNAYGLALPDFREAEKFARSEAEGHDCVGFHECDAGMSRAYLSLLETVAPLLEMEPWLVQGPWERFRGVPNEREEAFIVQARNTADALRDLLGPTGGRA